MKFRPQNFRATFVSLLILFQDVVINGSSPVRLTRYAEGYRVLVEQVIKNDIVAILARMVDRMLFCTFTQFIPAQEYYWRNINRSMIKNSSSIGGCMKMCVESPDCVSISVVKEGEIVLCNLFAPSQQPIYYQKGLAATLNYDLERSTTNDSCPLAESLFPAS